MRTLTKYFATRERTIRSLLARPSPRWTPATFHALRVEIKKLNALFKLLKFCVDDFDRKQMIRPFKEVFQHAGMVRELQVEEAMLREFFRERTLGEYRRHLWTRRRKEVRDFHALLTTALLGEIDASCEAIPRYLERIEPSELRRCAERTRIQIEALLRQSLMDEAQLHTLRKRLKELGYNRRFLHAGSSAGPNGPKDLLPELLGRWRDSQVSASHLAIAIESGLVSVEESRTLKRVRATVSADGRRLLRMVRSAVRSRLS
jgi:CHAD domain-containing protein